MKKIIFPIITLASAIVHAQIGINSADPKATMDIVAKTTDGSRPEGLIIPRLTGNQIRSANTQYSTAQIGALIYAISADSTPAGKTANITSAGYYFFDGNIWQKVLSGTGSYDITNDSWVNDSDNVMVKLGTRSDGSTSRTSGTEFVILDNGKVGLGTSSPKGALEINSTVAGFVLPRMTALQRDAIALGSRPTGTMIFNLTNTRVEFNSGTDAIPVWTPLAQGSSTINTSAIYQKTASQTVGTTAQFISYDTTPLYSNTPGGFVIQNDSSTFTIAGGKTYKIEIDNGTVVGTTGNSFRCTMLVDGNPIGESRGFPTTMVDNVSGPNSAIGFASPSSDAELRVSCISGGGTKTLASSGAYNNPYPRISITIMN